MSKIHHKGNPHTDQPASRDIPRKLRSEPHSSPKINLGMITAVVMGAALFSPLVFMHQFAPIHVEAQSDSDNTYDFVTEWRGEGGGNDQAGIAVDPVNGFVYVADIGNNHILKFTSNGSFVGQWGSFGSGDGQLREPTDVAVDSSGDVYVTDSQNGRIQKFASNGTYLSQWKVGQDGQDVRGQQGIAIDESDNVYVADTAFNRIIKFSNGERIDEWSSPGTADGDLYFPRDVAVAPDGYVYVADSYNNRVQKFTSDGQYVLQWNSFVDPNDSSSTFELYDPKSVAVSTDGYIYVAASGVHKYSSNGTFIQTVGLEQSPDGFFFTGVSSDAVGLAADSQGGIYSVGQGVIEHVSIDGKLVSKWESDGPLNQRRGSIGALEVDSNGFVYLVDTAFNRIQKYAPNGTAVAKWGHGGSGNGEFASPVDIAIDSAGNIYVVESDNRRIQKFTSDGKFILKWGSKNGMPDSMPGDFYYPRSIAIDSQDRVYVSDPANRRIDIFNASGGYIASWNMIDRDSETMVFSDVGIYDGGDLAIDSADNVFVIDSLNRNEPPYTVNRIAKLSIASNGEVIDSWDSYRMDQQFGLLSSIAIDTEDNLYVSDPSSGVLAKLSVSGELLAMIGHKGDDSGEFRDNAPTSAAVGPSGVVYAVDGSDIEVFVPASITSGLDKAPLISAPDIVVVNATDPRQFYVNASYTVTATDDIDDPDKISLDCTPPSGSGFIAGYNTTVTCYATDSAGNVARKSFSVQVNPAPTLPESIPEAKEHYSFIKKWGSRTDFAVLYAGSVATDINGNTYVRSIQVQDFAIQKFNMTDFPIVEFGAHGTGPGQLDSPFGVGADPTGKYLYITDYGKVVKFSADGQFEMEWRKAGNTELSDYIYAVAADSKGDVYVADMGNQRIVKYTEDGQYISEWGSDGPGDGQFSVIMSIAIGDNDDVFVADPGYNRIQRFTSNGSYLNQWQVGEDPIGVAADLEGNILVVDQGSDNLTKYTPDGELISQIGLTLPGRDKVYPIGLSVDPSSGVIHVAVQNGGVYNYDSSGKYLSTLAFNKESVGNFRSPYALALDNSTGNLYVLDNVDARIQKFTGNGTFLSQWLVGDAVNGQIAEATDIAVDSEGNVYVVAGSVIKFSSDGRRLASWGSAGVDDGEFQGMRAIAIGNDDRIYVADSGNYRIQAFTPDGKYELQWQVGDSGATSGQQVFPEDIAVDSDGNVYVLGSFTNTIQKFTGDGRPISEMNLTRGIIGPGGMPISVFRIALDRSDNVYAAYLDGVVRKYANNGTYLAQVASRGSADGQVYFPTGVAVGASDTVYVLDGGNVRVQMFSLTGQADVPEFYMISSTVVAVAIGTIVAMFRFFRGRFF